MSLPHLSTQDVIKLFTRVPHKFVDDFFHLYDRNNTEKTNFIIDLDKLATWLKTRKSHLCTTLKESYRKNVDFTQKYETARKTSQAYGGNRFIRVMITPDCMKRLCMRSRSKMAETVRTYFIEIEEFLFHYNDEIVDGLMRKIQDLGKKDLLERKKDGPGVVYIIRAGKESSSLNKLGQTKDLISRLATYNTGRDKDVEVLSVYKTPYKKEVEKCVKKLMEVKRYKKRREIYHVDWEVIAKLIAGCAEFSLKLHRASAKSKMDGEYYMIFTSDADADTNATPAL